MGHTGRDRIFGGGGGGDSINVADGVAGDRVVGGPGTDSCVIDESDHAEGCASETVTP